LPSFTGSVVVEETYWAAVEVGHIATRSPALLISQRNVVPTPVHAWIAMAQVKARASRNSLN
jgi:hypothetical protein